MSDPVSDPVRERESPFFVGWAAIPEGLRWFLVGIALGLLLLLAGLSYLTAATQDDPGAGAIMGRADAVGMLQATPYPILHVTQSESFDPGPALMLTGNGKRGAQAQAEPRKRPPDAGQGAGSSRDDQRQVEQREAEGGGCGPQLCQRCESDLQHARDGGEDEDEGGHPRHRFIDRVQHHRGLGRDRSDEPHADLGLLGDRKGGIDPAQHRIDADCATKHFRVVMFRSANKDRLPDQNRAEQRRGKRPVTQADHRSRARRVPPDRAVGGRRQRS